MLCVCMLCVCMLCVCICVFAFCVFAFCVFACCVFACCVFAFCVFAFCVFAFCVFAFCVFAFCVFAFCVFVAPKETRRGRCDEGDAKPSCSPIPTHAAFRRPGLRRAERDVTRERSLPRAFPIRTAPRFGVPICVAPNDTRRGTGHSLVLAHRRSRGVSASRFASRQTRRDEGTVTPSCSTNPAHASFRCPDLRRAERDVKSEPPLPHARPIRPAPRFGVPICVAPNDM
jgi:hypothetical protein